MEITRWQERTANGTIIHSGRPDGLDMTLCGYAEEGTCIDGDPGELKSVSRGKISCPDCVGIIRFGKAFPSRYLAKGPH